MWYEKPAPENGVDLWHRFLERVSWVLITGTDAVHVSKFKWISAISGIQPASQPASQSPVNLPNTKSQEFIVPTTGLQPICQDND